MVVVLVLVGWGGTRGCLFLGNGTWQVWLMYYTTTATTTTLCRRIYTVTRQKCRSAMTLDHKYNHYCYCYYYYYYWYYPCAYREYYATFYCCFVSCRVVLEIARDPCERCERE